MEYDENGVEEILYTESGYSRKLAAKGLRSIAYTFGVEIEVIAKPLEQQSFASQNSKLEYWRLRLATELEKSGLDAKAQRHGDRHIKRIENYHQWYVMNDSSLSKNNRDTDG